MITLTARALRDVLEFVNPDGPASADQLSIEVTIVHLEADKTPVDETTKQHLSAGYYAWLAEHPEEGSYGPLGASTTEIADTNNPSLPNQGVLGGDQHG
jgi:hypothetical protein